MWARVPFEYATIRISFNGPQATLVADSPSGMCDTITGSMFHCSGDKSRGVSKTHTPPKLLLEFVKEQERVDMRRKKEDGQYEMHQEFSSGMRQQMQCKLRSAKKLPRVAATVITKNRTYGSAKTKTTSYLP